MELKNWNRLQSDLFQEYNIDSNIQLLLSIAKDISYLKSIDYNINESILRDIIENSILNHTKDIISKYNNKAELEYIYKHSCSENSINSNCTIQDFKNHLISKLELFKNFHTNKLHDTVCRIIKYINI